jgi:hypothetical protein
MKTNLLFLCIFTIVSASTTASAQLTFTDIAAGDNAGVTYRRAENPASVAIFDALKAQPFYSFFDDLPSTPIKARGTPGVALIDFDRDGDIDIYVTNGPGADNSLYSNQLVETGQVTFIDVAVAAGVAATAQNSSGVCFGDIDNDGDPDLMVLGNGEANKLFENLGDGTFDDISVASGVTTGSVHSTGCSMGDVNGDGLLDIAVSNSFDNRDQLPIFVVPYALSEPNQLLLNQGGNVFADGSAASGFRDVATVPQVPSGTGTISWAIAMVDIDLDGDIDIVTADDQAALPPAFLGGVDRGMIQFFENDGTGVFTNTTLARGVPPGAWMGLSFGDFNSDGLLDLFGSNFGNRGLVFVLNDPDIIDLINDASRHFLLQTANGSFVDGVDLQPDLHVPFGWGTGAVDYDNDGDTDILAHGGIDQGLIVITSPAIVLNNDGNAFFSRDADAFANSTDHIRRTVHGMAVGDLNNDGFTDVVSVSNFNLPNAPVIPAPMLGGAFDGDVVFAENFVAVNPERTMFTFSGLQLPHDGTLSVELSSADNGNGSVQISLLGTKGLTTGGAANRDGIGATLTFTPHGGRPVIKPILGGSSHASQHSLVATLGLGQAQFGTVEVLWPGGVKNRLYVVQDGSRIVIPEIPCSIDDQDLSFPDYVQCVGNAIDELLSAGAIDHSAQQRLRSSAILGYQDAHNGA